MDLKEILIAIISASTTAVSGLCAVVVFLWRRNEKKNSQMTAILEKSSAQLVELAKKLTEVQNEAIDKIMGLLAYIAPDQISRKRKKD